MRTPFLTFLRDRTYGQGKEFSMSGQKKGGQDGRAPGGGGYSKRGKPRPGTGGNRRDKLEGKGPTPPAYMRPGHPAQRAAAKAARGAGRPGEAGGATSGAARAAAAPSQRVTTRRARGSGEGPEMVAGRNSVVESLRARDPGDGAVRRGPGAGGRAGRGGRAAGGGCGDRGPRSRGARARPADRRRDPPGGRAAGAPLRVRAPRRFFRTRRGRLRPSSWPWTA